MADFQVPDKNLLTSVDRSADSFLIYDNSASQLKRTNVDYALDLTSHPAGINDVQTLTNKTVTAPTITSPVLSGTITGTYTIGGTPTFPSAVVTLTGSQSLTNKTLTSPTINNAVIANPTLTVDTISEYTGAAGVTIDGVLLKDSKVNGSYLTNASVTSTQLQDGSVTGPKLATSAIFLGYAEATTDQGSITTIVDLTSLSVTVTVPSGGRRVKITGYVRAGNSTADSISVVYIFEGTTQLQAATILTRSGGSGAVYMPLYVGTATAGSHTYKLRMDNGGSGTAIAKASTNAVNFILVELI